MSQSDMPLFQKLRELPAEKLAEVEDFADFLRQRVDRDLAQAATRASESSFAKVWDNPSDAEYDRL